MREHIACWFQLTKSHFEKDSLVGSRVIELGPCCTAPGTVLGIMVLSLKQREVMHGPGINYCYLVDELKANFPRYLDRGSYSIIG